MHHIKKLTLLLIFSLSIPLAGEESFRGKSLDELAGTSIPISFMNLVSNNYDILPSQINPQRGGYLIISPDGIAAYLDDFVEFKESQGFDVYVMTLSETGPSAGDIKSAIDSKLSEDPMLEYVLLIGDVDGFAECPSFYYGPENDVTDQQYSHLVGDDVIPDVFVGRLSIDSLSDLAVIFSKTIQYARDPLAFDQDWLDRGLVVAGNYSNTYPIPITPKWTSYWLMEELMDYGYAQVDTVFYPPIQQGASYIIPIIDNGVGIVNYRGWGDANGWHYPEFHVEDVNDLNNGWLTPVFMSYVCNSNDFANSVDPCLAEAVLRGGTPTVPKGGVAFIGPSDLHTSTKYNNVINAYMYDAMLNHDVVELGPAMQAGQYGLTKEFPAQSGAGEAQEFYANVYNILGDPSLQVYLDRPKQFLIEASELTRDDGLLQLMIKDNETGLGVGNAVLSIMSEGQMLAKGVTDMAGEFMTSLDLDGLPSVDIYSNKGGFMQGKETIPLQDSDQALHLKSVNLHTDSGISPTLGSNFSFDILLENTSESNLAASFASITFSDQVSPSSINIDVPAIEANQTALLEGMEITTYNTDIGNSILGNLSLNGDMEITFDFAIDLEMPVFNIEFTGEVSPGDQFQPELLITNYTSGIYSDVSIQISELSEGANVIFDDALGYSSSFDSFESSSHQTNYAMTLADVSIGSDLTFLVEFQKDANTFFSQEVSIHLSPTTTNYPVAPNNYGYWAYDDLDEGFEQRPIFDWVELDPNYGGSGATHYQLDDDDHVDIELPFPFKYHGVQYDQITISSNGWTSFEGCDIDYFWNMSIPMYMGPKAMLAPFSDDLETIDTDEDGVIDKWIDVYVMHDESNGRLIMEWSRALNGYDEVTEETFEVILYDQSSMPTESGDGVIEFQYLTIEDVDVTKNYSTVGIEAPEKNYGLQYVFNNVYAPGAAPLDDERVIRFTTEAPSNYVQSLESEEDVIPNAFVLSPAYPNPFNPKTHIDITIPITDRVTINIYDIMGREILNLHEGILVNGNYQFSWSGKNFQGKTMASGAYFVMAKYRDNTEIQKLLFLK